MIDLEYDPATLLSPFPPERLPVVVAWECFEPVAPVAPSFGAFLGQLFRCPEGIVSGPAENW